ncbi:MAG: hypothetical protein MI741_18770, partial [Rhodospirillales bacterium]|nr:hypothetical protein [Rhodospirillales bacterium]
MPDESNDKSQYLVNQPGKGGTARRRQGRGGGTSLLAHGEPMVWLTGGGLTLCLVMIIVLLAFILWKGLGTFIPLPITHVQTHDGETYLGEITRDELYRPQPDMIASLDEEARKRADEEMQSRNGYLRRQLIRIGNFELTGARFQWVDDFRIEQEAWPKYAMIVERETGGVFFGDPAAFVVDGENKVDVGEKQGDARIEVQREIWQSYNDYYHEVEERKAEIHEIDKSVIGKLNTRIDRAKIRLKGVELRYGEDSQQYREAAAEFEELRSDLEEQVRQATTRINELRAENNKYAIRFETAQNQQKNVTMADIVRMYPANAYGFSDKVGVYFAR